MTNVTVVRLKPNQTMTIGSHAMSAMAWKNSRIGQKMRRATRIIATAKPSGSPMSRPKPTP
ncbi:hypothetical protein ACIQFZ_37285 [Streptomyces sp. NPDC093064]|uniref:hypothetical protein n=1 Tax=Streptomyces sp. NPDC093064 TaxID=3366020 RepID=UPI0038137362